MSQNQERAERGKMILDSSGYDNLHDLLVDLAAYAAENHLAPLSTIASYAEQRIKNNEVNKPIDDGPF